MRRHKSTGKIKKAAAWLLVVSGLCILLPNSTFAEYSSTTASVNFTSESTTEPVGPVDPDQPGIEVPINPPARETVTVRDGESVPAGESEQNQSILGATGTAGLLAINYVTPLSYNIEVEKGVFTVMQERPYLQTSDLRGTASGWKVTAIAGPFHDPETMSPIPALLSFSCGTANSAYTYFSPPEIPNLIELPANGRMQRLIEIAEEDEGVGIWVVRWYQKHGAAHDFQLRLFSPVTEGRLGFVLWVMNDAP